MNLPPVVQNYQPGVQNNLQNAIRNADNQNLKLDRDNFLESGSICLKAPNGNWYVLGVDNSGTLTTTQLSGDRLDANNRPLIASTNPYS